MNLVDTCLSMEEAQQMEWAKAQDIKFNIDLVAAAKQQLKFLAAVDSTGCLYNGPAFERAIYRYKNYWLPLLAKHMNCPIFEGSLVVPLDCEWIWHCHRLNPVQYSRDCEKIYGKILGKLNVLSTVEGSCPKQTRSIWKRIYVTEPYELDLSNVETPMTNNGIDAKAPRDITIEYDLVAAVERQSSFFNKVSKMMDYGDSFMEEAVARYKAFHHMIKINKERNLNCSCVPTHDIDLIWHSHQLYPVAYCKEMKAMYGNILDHNDRDSRSSKGKKMMELGFLQTKQIWEEIFGSKYCIDSPLSLLKSKYKVPRCMMDHVQGLTISRAQSRSETSEESTVNASSCNILGCRECMPLESETSEVTTVNASSCNILGCRECMPRESETSEETIVNASSCNILGCRECMPRESETFEETIVNASSCNILGCRECWPRSD